MFWTTPEIINVALVFELIANIRVNQFSSVIQKEFSFLKISRCENSKPCLQYTYNNTKE